MKNNFIDQRANIEDAKQRMGKEAAEIIANELGFEKWDGKKCCCKWHDDSDPSMSWSEENNCFHCFACNTNYGILDHYIQYHRLTYQEAAQKLCESQGIEFKVFKKKDKDKKYVYPKTDKQEERSKVESYLAKRHISKATLDYAEIGQDGKGNIVFEYRDFDNTLLNVKYRPAGAVAKGNAKMWFQVGASNCQSLFLKQKIDVTKPLLITEGEGDTLSAIESGFTNTVSIPNGTGSTGWLEYDFDFLEQFEKIIIWADDDEPGKKMISECVPRLGNYRCYVVKIPEQVKTALTQAVADKKIRNDCGDANNVLITCGKETVLSLIENAECTPSKRLKYLMDAEEKDIKSMPQITFGFKALDQQAYGNFLPCFNIITGYTGAGKSTVSTTMSIISPIENGYKTMVFSGELQEGQLKNWTLRPLSSRRHTVVWNNPGQPDGYSLSKQAAIAISDYYREKIILYADDDDFDTPTGSLLEEMEYAYKRYGVQFFLIDNLMSVNLATGGEDSEWKSQKNFIKQLMSFTNKYSVNVTLVVHPKKPGQNKEQSAYELHGASEIANLCHRLFWVSNINGDDQGYNSMITLIKDRPAGKHGIKVKLFYDNATMRLYSDQDELNKQYSWEQNFNPNYPQDFLPRLVCNQGYNYTTVTTSESDLDDYIF